MIRIDEADIGAVEGSRVAPGDEDRAVGQSGLAGTEYVRIVVRNVCEALAFAYAIALTVVGARVTIVTIFTAAYAIPIVVLEAVGLEIPDHSLYKSVGIGASHGTRCGKYQHPSGLGPAGGRQVRLVRGPEPPAERTVPCSYICFDFGGLVDRFNLGGRAGPRLPGR
jgi:hypothetical protein